MFFTLEIEGDKVTSPVCRVSSKLADQENRKILNKKNSQIIKKKKRVI